MSNQTQTQTQTLVAEKDRLAFLPRFFGSRLMLRGEALVFAWMGALNTQYCGGFWEFYELSNGGFYMAPSGDLPVQIEVEGNGFAGEMSANAAGIIATLFALGQLAAEQSDERLIDLYHLLLDFADDHPEAGMIFAAID